MSSGNGASNNWTFVSPEGTAAETLKPMAEATEHQVADMELTWSSTNGIQQMNGTDRPAEREPSPPVEEHVVPKDKAAELIGDTSAEQITSVPPASADAPVPTALENSDSFVPANHAQEKLPEGPTESNHDPDSFSDSYTHMTPCSDETPSPRSNAETVGAAEFMQEGERLAEEATPHLPDEEKLQQEEDELFPKAAESEKQEDASDSAPALAECEEKTEATEGSEDPELRRRRKLLASLEEIGRTEEEEDREEEFQMPRREEDSGITLNKCIVGAVILLGLGTIFISGVFMDVDDESDYGKIELRDSEVPGKQEWLNRETPPPLVDADGTELLEKLSKENQQIPALQAELQAQKEELNVAKEQVAEGAMERLLLEEMEKENSRLKTTVACLPLLQKENERMKRELESARALQKEVETLRSTVTELKRSSAAIEGAQPPGEAAMSPSSGESEKSSQSEKKEKYDTGKKKQRKEEKEKYEWKKEEKRERKDGGKSEWKKGKHEEVKFDKGKDKDGKQKKHSDETKHSKENEWKKEKMYRGDEGKPWKMREGVERSERKHPKEAKEWKKGKHEKVNEDKHEKDWKRGKEHREKHGGSEEWKGEKEWKKARKDGKEKGEKREWKKATEWGDKNGRDGGKERKREWERKQWEESEVHSKSHDRERKSTNGRKRLEENERKSKNGKEWKRKEERSEWKKEEGKSETGQKEKGHSEKHHHDETVWGDKKAPHKHHRPTIGEPEYWLHQREQLLHSSKAPQKCDTLETCANTEGLLPVPFAEFDAILQKYLAKAEGAGVQAPRREELKKLAAEFFRDGVFVHDQMSFQDFAEDVGEILEDMVEEDEDESGAEADSALEEEMEAFEREVIIKFSVPGAAQKEEKIQVEQMESGRGRG